MANLATKRWLVSWNRLYIHDDFGLVIQKPVQVDDIERFCFDGVQLFQFEHLNNVFNGTSNQY